MIIWGWVEGFVLDHNHWIWTCLFWDMPIWMGMGNANDSHVSEGAQAIIFGSRTCPMNIMNGFCPTPRKGWRWQFSRSNFWKFQFPDDRLHLPTHRPEFPNMEKGEFIYFMEKHVEYEFDAFKEIFERFDEDGHLAALAHLTSRRKLADLFGCLCPRLRNISLFSWTHTTQYPVFPAMIHGQSFFSYPHTEGTALRDQIALWMSAVWLNPHLLHWDCY